MSSKLKIKPKKRKLPLAQNNQAAQAFEFDSVRLWFLESKKGGKK